MPPVPSVVPAPEPAGRIVNGKESFAPSVPGPDAAWTCASHSMEVVTGAASGTVRLIDAPVPESWQLLSAESPANSALQASMTQLLLGVNATVTMSPGCPLTGSTPAVTDWSSGIMAETVDIVALETAVVPTASADVVITPAADSPLAKIMASANEANAFVNPELPEASWKKQLRLCGKSTEGSAVCTPLRERSRMRPEKKPARLLGSTVSIFSTPPRSH